MVKFGEMIVVGVLLLLVVALFVMSQIRNKKNATELSNMREDLKNDQEGMLALVRRYFHCG